MLHNLNKYHKTIKTFKHYVHLNAKQINRYNTSQCPYLDQVTLRWEAQAVDSVCPAVSPLTKLLWRLGESHVGSDGAVDDGLGGKIKCNMTLAQIVRRKDGNSKTKLDVALIGCCKGF